MAATPVDANLDGVDAGDLVSFAIVIENTGTAPNGAFDVLVQDTLPAGFVVPTGGLNLDVRDGAGNAIGFTTLAGGLFGSGIELNDGAIAGAIADFDPTAGDNIAVITYDLLVDTVVGPDESLDNIAEVANFAAFDTGGNRVPAAGIEDDAQVTTLTPDVTKSIIDTSVGNNTSNQVLIGETVTYEIVIDLNEGTTEDVVLIDRTRFANTANDPTDGALEILGAQITSIGSNLTLQNPFAVNAGPSTAPFDTNGDGVNDRLEFNFGDIVNTPDNVADANDQIVVEVTALVTNNAQTVGGDLFINEARLEYENTFIRDRENVRVRESNVSIDKSVIPTIVDGGDQVRYRVEITNDQLIVNNNNRSADAFDLVLTDIINDPDLTLVPGSVVLSGAAAGSATVSIGNGPGDTTIEVLLDQLNTQDNLIIEYDATVSLTLSLIHI